MESSIEASAVPAGPITKCSCPRGSTEELAAANLLVPHEEVPLSDKGPEDGITLIRPEEIPFVSYPYEWSFSQLQDAALATLEIEKRALRRGMTLIDASAYNIQFLRGRPVLIDTLSLRRAVEGEPWTAYRQYCQHFLAPLALMSLRDVRLGQLLRIHIDGIPLDLTSSLLPYGSWPGPTLFSTSTSMPRVRSVLMDARSSVSKGKGWPPCASRASRFPGIRHAKARMAREGNGMGRLLGDTNYSPDGLDDKRKAVGEFISAVRPRTVWDLGGNVGTFSRVAATSGAHVVSFDIDPSCVERNYLRVRAEKEPNLLPLLVDLANPSPAAGWENLERMSLIERGPADAVLALALIHHMAIGNNVPLEIAARFFAKVGRSLLIEFVPKSDSQVKRLLVTREDIFDRYSREEFERTFGQYFVLTHLIPLRGSERLLYHMDRI